MTDEEYKERVGMIEALAERFPASELTEQNVRGYVWSLSDLSIPTMAVAVERTIDTHKFSTLPTVAEIRENAIAVSVSENGGKHPDSCACFGTGMILPEKVDGYSPGARRCDGVVPDGDDSDIQNW